MKGKTKVVWGPSFPFQISHEYKVNDKDQGSSPTHGKDGCSLELHRRSWPLQFLHQHQHLCGAEHTGHGSVGKEPCIASVAGFSGWDRQAGVQKWREGEGPLLWEPDPCMWHPSSSVGVCGSVEASGRPGKRPSCLRRPHTAH